MNQDIELKYMTEQDIAEQIIYPLWLGIPGTKRKKCTRKSYNQFQSMLRTSAVQSFGNLLLFANIFCKQCGATPSVAVWRGLASLGGNQKASSRILGKITKLLPYMVAVVIEKNSAVN